MTLTGTIAGTLTTAALIVCALAAGALAVGLLASPSFAPSSLSLDATARSGGFAFPLASWTTAFATTAAASCFASSTCAAIMGTRLARGAVFGITLKSLVSFCAASGSIAVASGTDAGPRTVTLWSAATGTAGPIPCPDAPSSRVTSISPRSTVIADVAFGPGSTSATTTVPRMAAIAFTVRISTVSAGLILSFATATEIRPLARFTVEVPGISVMFRTECSRTVTTALPPSRRRVTDCSPVATRSWRNTGSLNRSGAGASSDARVTVTVPWRATTVPAGVPCADAEGGKQKAFRNKSERVDTTHDTQTRVAEPGQRRDGTASTTKPRTRRLNVSAWS